MFHFRRFWLEAPDYILQFLTTMLVRTKFTTPEPKLPSLTTITSSARMSSMATPAFITRCQFHQHFMRTFFVRLCNFWVKKYRRKSCSYNVDEFDYRAATVMMMIRKTKICLVSSPIYPWLQNCHPLQRQRPRQCCHRLQKLRSRLNRTKKLLLVPRQPR